MSAIESLVNSGIAEPQTESKKGDKRSLTSGINGLKGGRPPIHAEVLAEKFLDHIQKPLKKYRDEWFLHNGKSYERFPDHDLEAKIFSFLQIHKKNIGNSEEDNLKISNNIVRDIMGNLAGYCNLSSKCLMPFFIEGQGDGKSWMSMNNGLINIEKIAAKINGEIIEEKELFRPHTPDLFSTFAMDYNYDPAASCPIFFDYLSGVQPSQDFQDCLQMLAGLSLVPDTRYEVILGLR